MSYRVEPFRQHDGMGRHSAYQSWTTYGGTLEIAADKVTLVLSMSTDTSAITCPPDWNHRTSMQACAGPDAKSGTTASSLTLDGFSRWENGKLTISVRRQDTAVTLSCDAQSERLECSYDDEYTLFRHTRPAKLVFARS